MASLFLQLARLKSKREALCWASDQLRHQPVESALRKIKDYGVTLDQEIADLEREYKAKSTRSFHSEQGK